MYDLKIVVTGVTVIKKNLNTSTTQEKLSKEKLIPGKISNKRKVTFLITILKKKQQVANYHKVRHNFY